MGLNGAGIRKERIFSQEQAIAQTEFCLFLTRKQATHATEVYNGVLGRALWLALKKVSNGCNGVDLELLVRVKLKLQLRLASYSSETPCVTLCFASVCRLEDVRRIRFELVVASESFV